MLSPEILSFSPSGERGKQVQIGMSQRLGRSFRHIHQQAKKPADLPAGSQADAIDRLVAGLEEGRPAKPEVFALHSDLIAAVTSDELAAVHQLFEELATRSFLREERTVRTLDTIAFSAPSRERYLHYAATDPDTPLDLTSPRDDETAAFGRRLDEAFDLIGRAAPEILGELDALVGEIVVATVDDTDDDHVFDGISVFDLWGSLFINPRRHATVLETAEVLVHEAAHSLLFGFCLDEPLVRNPVAERYASPVRQDARPMDGVFHGTYVIASLHYLLTRLIDSGLQSAVDQHQSVETRGQYGEPFEAGIKVIRDHGNLTETGRQVIDSAEAYMKSVR